MNFSAEEQLALVERARVGDEAAFASLYGMMSPRLRHALSRIVPQSDIEDVVQETMLKAYAHLDGFNGDSQFSSWCTRIGINTALMHRRKLTREYRYVAGSLDDKYTTEDGAEESRFGEPGAEDTTWESKMLFDQIIHAADSELSEDQRLVLMLRADDASMGEIAEMIGKTVPAVKALLHRGRSRLFEALAA